MKPYDILILLVTILLAKVSHSCIFSWLIDVNCLFLVRKIINIPIFSLDFVWFCQFLFTPLRIEGQIGQIPIFHRCKEQELHELAVIQAQVDSSSLRMLRGQILETDNEMLRGRFLDGKVMDFSDLVIHEPLKR